MKSINKNIVIMGPIGVGKSSVAIEVAKQLDIQRVQLDEERMRIYEKTDFSNEEERRQYELKGIMGWYNYQKPYELLSVSVILSHYSEAVIDFGGGQSVYEDKEQVTKFLGLMEPVENSFLLMPYEDEDESIYFLSKRVNENESKMNELFVKSRSSRLAAKHVIYTKMKTVKEIANEIIIVINGSVK